MHISILPLLPLTAALTAQISLNIDATPQTPLLTTAPACDCAGTNDTGKTTGSTYICRDPRLGPKKLPRRFPLLSFVTNYDRFGGETPGAFLAKWTDPKSGWFVYPPQNGFQLDEAGKPILGNMTLVAGAKVDRFGSEYGKCLLLLSLIPGSGRVAWSRAC